MTPVPSNASPWLTVAADGVAVVAGTTLIILAADGSVVATIGDSTSAEPVSLVAATADGGVLYSDDRYAYRVDVATGRQVWQTPLGPNLNPSEFVSPAAPVLDPAGRLYVSGLDGNLWVLDAGDGSVLGTSPLGLTGSPHMIEMGVGNMLFVGGISRGALSLFSTDTASVQAELSFPDTTVQPNVIAGFQIGLVEFGYIDTTIETTRTAVLDSCFRPRWTVPGSYSYPLVIGFDDDLIVRDKVPLGDQMYQYALRRFSRDGALLAKAAQSGDVSSAILGADDVLYFFDGTAFVGLDRALSVTTRISPGPATYSGGGILNDTGKLFFRCTSGTAAGICAVQTTSPGPAPVSWSREYPRDSRSTFWLAP